MSLMENVSEHYSSEDGRRVEAIAKTLMEQFYSRELTNPEQKSIRSMAHNGDPRSKHCVQVAGVIMNYLREELE